MNSLNFILEDYPNQIPHKEDASSVFNFKLILYTYASLCYFVKYAIHLCNKHTINCKFLL